MHCGKTAASTVIPCLTSAAEECDVAPAAARQRECDGMTFALAVFMSFFAERLKAAEEPPAALLPFVSSFSHLKRNS